MLIVPLNCHSFVSIKSALFSIAIANYKFMCTTDEDFATAKAPPNKKARASVKECQQDKTRKNEIIDLTAKPCKERYMISFFNIFNRMKYSSQSCFL